MKTILHVSTAHHPSDHRIFHKEAVGLAASGYKVALAITVDRPQVRNEVEFIPLGRYGGSRWLRISRGLRASLTMLSTSADLIHIHDPELLFLVVPALLAGKRVVYDIHEFYHQRFLDSDWVWPVARSFAARLYSLFEQLLLPRFAGIVVVTESMEEMYRRRFPRVRLALVRNYPLLDEALWRLAQSKEAPVNQPYIVHTGGAKKGKGFHILLAVAEKLRERRIAAPIINIGPVDLSAFPIEERSRLLQRANDAGVRLTGPLDHPEALRWVAHARVGYVLYPDTQNFRLALSTKLYEYFFLGLPIVATSVGRMGELVREHQAGLVVAPDDIEAHADAFERLLTDDDLAQQTARASREASKHFTFQSELASLLSLYGLILGAEADGVSVNP